MTDEADGPNTGAASSPVSASAMVSSAGGAPGATRTIPTFVLHRSQALASLALQDPACLEHDGTFAGTHERVGLSDDDDFPALRVNLDRFVPTMPDSERQLLENICRVNQGESLAEADHQHGVASSGDGSGHAQQGKCKPLKRPRGKRGGNRGHTKRRARNSEHNNTIRNQMRAKLNGKVAMCTQRAGKCPREALASWDSSGNIGWCRQCWVEFYGKSKVYDTAQEQQKDAAPSGVVEDK